MAQRSRAAALGHAPCCSSATRPITGASASRPKTGPCGCRAPSSASGSSASNSARRARRRPRPRLGRRRFEKKPDLARLVAASSAAPAAPLRPAVRALPPDPREDSRPLLSPAGREILFGSAPTQRRSACLPRRPSSTQETCPMTNWPVHARISGPIVMIGFGSIGKGTLPLIERHFEFDKKPLRRHRSRRQRSPPARRARHQVRPAGRDPRQLPRRADAAAHRGAAARASASISRSTPPRSTSWSSAASSARSTSTPSTSRGSASISTRARARGAHQLRAARGDPRGAPQKPGGPTAVSCCGANPGMVSWFVKQALLNIAARSRPRIRRAERPARMGAPDAAGRRQGHPHRRARHPARHIPRSRWASSSTPGRSRASSEGMQPAELGWGTHESWMPENARTHEPAAGPRST